MYNWLKIGAFIVAGRFLKPRLKGLLALVVFWFLVSFLHGEYRDYVQLSGNTTHIIAMALAKIGLYVLGFAIYVLTVERGILNRARREIEAKHMAARDTEADDGFDFLRQKRKLQDPADKLLNKD